jgi:HEAT repeat protein
LETTIETPEAEFDLAVRICEGCHRTITREDDCPVCSTRAVMLSWRELRRLRRTLATRGASRSDLAERRRNALKAVAAAGDLRLVPEIAALLIDDWVVVREAAAVALGVLKAREAVGSLTQCLTHDKSTEVRRAAGMALGALGDPSAVVPLVNVERAVPAARGWVTDALAQLGAPAVPALIRLLSQKGKRPSITVIAALGRIGDPRAVGPLIHALGEAKNAERAAIAESLGMLNQASACETLLRLLVDDDPIVTQRAAAALARVASPACAEALVPHLKAANAAVRGDVATAIARTGVKRAACFVAPLVGDEDAAVRRKAVVALGVLGGAAELAFLERALRDSSAEVRERAAESLGKLGAAQSMPHLCVLLEDNYQTVRRAAAAALGRIGDAAAVPALARALEFETFTEVKLAIVIALGEINDPSALKPLEQALQAEASVRCRAAISIAHIGSEAAVPMLLPLLDDPVAEVRHHAVNGLGRILRRAAIRHIEHLCSDTNTLVLRSVARLLEEYGDSRAREVAQRAKQLAEQPLAAGVALPAAGLIGRLLPSVLLGMATRRVALVAVLGVVALAAGMLLWPRPIPVEVPLAVPTRQVGILASAFAGGTRLAAITTSGRLCVWDVEREEPVSTSALPGAVDLLAVSPDGTTVAVAGSDQVIRLLDSATGKTQSQLAGHAGAVRLLMFSKDQDAEALCSVGADRQVIVWNIRQLAAMRKLSIDGTERLTAISCSADLRHIAAGSEKGQVRLVPLDGFGKVATFQACPAEIRTLALSPDGRMLAAADVKGAVRLWNIDTRQRMRVLDEGRMQFSSLAFSSDGKLLAGGRAGGVRLWSLESGQPRELPVSFSRGRHPATLESITSVAFAENGARLIAAGPSNAEILVWKAQTAQRERILVAR